MRQKKPTIIIGMGGHARSIAGIIEVSKTHKLLGFVDQTKPKSDAKGKFLGLYADIESILEKYRSAALVIGIGDNALRQKTLGELKAFQQRLATLIHPTAVIAKNTRIEAGTVIMAGVIVNTGGRIGAQVILNTGCILDHDVAVGNFSAIGPGAILGGQVRLGESVAIGLGAKLFHGILIGNHTVIGAGAIVTKSFADHLVAYGSPAKTVRSRKAAERYL